MDIEKMTDEQLCDEACWSGRVHRTAACNTLLRRFRAKDERIAELEAEAVVMRELCEAVAKIKLRLFAKNGLRQLQFASLADEHSFAAALDAYRAMEGKPREP